MKTAYQVKITFDKTKDQVTNIESIAEKVNKKKQQLEDEIIRVSSSWKGSNANMYVDRMRRMEIELSEIQRDLKKIAIVVREIAENSYNADMQAVMIEQQNRIKN